MPDSTPSPLTLAIGTRDGLYLLEGDASRTTWTRRGPYLRGNDVSHAFLDSRDGATIWAAANGNDERAVYRSPDLGNTWNAHAREIESSQLWHIEPIPGTSSSAVYLGIAPAALYRTDDGGESWQPVAGFNNHDSKVEWWEGGGGMCLHTISPNPRQPDDLLLGMSVGGVFHSIDGGQTWEPRNNGIPSGASEWERFTEGSSRHDVHRCTHKLVRHPSNGVIYQQNHVGVYRSNDLGKEWVNISEGLSNPFGFVIGITADGAIYVVPQHDWEEEIGVRYTGQLAVYRSRDEGNSWDRLTNGLPEVSGMTLYREGLATDRMSPGGIYFGTSDGHLFQSADGGDSWRLIADDLPPIRSVECTQLG